MNPQQFLGSLHDHALMTFMLVFGWDDILIALALMIVSAAITALTTKKPANQNATPNTLTDFSLPNISEGTPQAVVFGDVWLVSWQVLYYGNLGVEAIRAKKSGKK